MLDIHTIISSGEESVGFELRTADDHRPHHLSTSLPRSYPLAAHRQNAALYNPSLALYLLLTTKIPLFYQKKF